jgi:hypothetical protein
MVELRTYRANPKSSEALWNVKAVPPRGSGWADWMALKPCANAFQRKNGANAIATASDGLMGLMQDLRAHESAHPLPRGGTASTFQTASLPTL